jgi:hypothetical protein
MPFILTINMESQTGPDYHEQGFQGFPQSHTHLLSHNCILKWDITASSTFNNHNHYIIFHLEVYKLII